jgi:exonuclease VII small subunit
MERSTQDPDQAMEAYRQAMEDLQWCREYLRNARLQVETLVNESA